MNGYRFPQPAMIADSFHNIRKSRQMGCTRMQTYDMVADAMRKMGFTEEEIVSVFESPEEAS